MKISILLTTFLFSSVGYAANLAKVHCEGQAAFTKFYTSGDILDDSYILIEPDYRLENMKLNLVLGGRLVEVFKGRCTGNDRKMCKLSSSSDEIILYISGREHNIQGVIVQPNKNKIKTKILCIN